MRTAIWINQMCSQRADKLTAGIETYHESLVYELQVLNALWILKKSSDHSGVLVGTEELCCTCILFFLFPGDINDLMILVMVIFRKMGTVKTGLSKHWKLRTSSEVQAT